MKPEKKQILIFGGTTEGRRLAESMCAAGFFCTVSVATQYGEQVMEEMPALTLHRGRMDAGQMEEFIKKGRFFAVVDATHPFAVEVSENIRKSLSGMSLPYIRLKRDTGIEETEGKNLRWFRDMESCGEALQETTGNVLLTTGSKDLSAFSKEELRKRLYVRVLPNEESIALCEKQGICGKQIIAMQGPFSTEMNEAIIRQFHISYLVTKESGNTGGFFEKVKAAGNAGIPVMVIGNPEKEEQGFSYEEAAEEIYRLAGEKPESPKLMVSLIGIGMGAEGLLTLEAKEKIQRADVIFGAQRLLEEVGEEKEKYPYYLAADIIPRLADMVEKEDRYKPCIKAAVLFSGDTGFYSGASKLYEELKKETKEKRLRADVEMLSGISSMSYLAAKARMNWQDAAVISLHGRKANIMETVRREKKTFVLVSGLEDMKYLGELFSSEEWNGLRITAGYRLSYPEEEIMVLTPSMCGSLEKEGLYCCFIVNERTAAQKVSHGLKDASFLRGSTPMTKEEVREISICKLALEKNSVLYDVGSGTGSVSVECARLSDEIQVYAIESDREAVELLGKNSDLFGLTNIEVIEAQAPEGMGPLPAPTHAFIGGSGGKMREILKVLYEKNPSLRVVINVITLETLGEITDLLKEFPVKEEDIVQVQISRAKKAGPYHLMQAENPIYIISFNFLEGLTENENT